MIRVRFIPAAEAELNLAYDGYEAVRIGLGAELAAEVERLLRIISEYPEIGARRSYGTRQIPLRRFPYLLVYRIRPDRVSITAFAHQRQKPNYWKNRRDEELPN